MPKRTTSILVTGSTGQIGSELTVELRRKYGRESVVAAFYPRRQASARPHEPSEYLDVTDASAIERVVREHDVDTIYHLAGVLSAVGEANREIAWRVNVDGLRNVLETSARMRLRVFWPSSVAVFGQGVPPEQAPQDAALVPRTIYGASKVAGELLCKYYHDSLGVDVRSVRYPGIISSETPPGGGTTDYAVEIFYAALQERRYTCFVRRDTVLPMMYMPDCTRAALELMDAPSSRVRYRMGYNVDGVSFSAGQLADEIAARLPGFECEFKPDFRQKIADSWPRSMDDSRARREWGWKPRCDLPFIVDDMLARLARRAAPAPLTAAPRL